MNKISEKILRDTELEVREIRNQDKKAAQELIAKSSKIEEGLAKENQDFLDDLYHREMRRILSLNSIENKKKILKAKRDLIENLFIELEEELSSDENLYLDFLEAMAYKGSISGSEMIIVSQKDRSLITDEFLKRINDRLYKEKGIDGILGLSEDPMDIKGLVLRRDRILFNGTMQVALEVVKKKNERGMTKILFGYTDKHRF